MLQLQRQKGLQGMPCLWVTDAQHVHLLKQLFTFEANQPHRSVLLRAEQQGRGEGGRKRGLDPQKKEIYGPSIFGSGNAHFISVPCWHWFGFLKNVSGRRTKLLPFSQGIIMIISIHSLCCSRDLLHRAEICLPASTQKCKKWPSNKDLVSKLHFAGRGFQRSVGI